MKDVLFLCTGNTCRSPMAECLFNARAKKANLPFQAYSAGAYAREGAPASPEARAAIHALGLSLDSHQARPLSKQTLQGISLVVAMTPQHAAMIRQRFPTLSIPVWTFSPPIPDPFGGSRETYNRTASTLDAQIITLLAELENT